MNASLIKQAGASPQAAQGIADLIVGMNGIPASKTTEIKALIAKGDFAAAEALIRGASRNAGPVSPSTAARRV